MPSLERKPVLLLSPSAHPEGTLGLTPLRQLRLVPHPRDGERFVLPDGQRTVVVAEDALRDPATADQLVELRLAGVRVVRARDYYERMHRRVMLDELDESWFIFDRPLRRRLLYLGVKRGADIVIGALGSLCVLLLVPLLWLAARLDDGGPVFFRQERVGRGAGVFRIWKFRTMRVDAEADGPMWATRNDGRVTRVGGLLRRTRLDEMPQFFNIVRGEMTLIGPRPERPVFVRTLGRAIPFYDRRHLIRPGITGWATVRFGYGDSVTDKWRSHEYDLYYLKHRSPLLDLEILLRTIVVIFMGRGQ